MRPLPQRLLDRLPGKPRSKEPSGSLIEDMLALLREENQRLESENRALKQQLLKYQKEEACQHSAK